MTQQEGRARIGPRIKATHHIRPRLSDSGILCLPLPSVCGLHDVNGGAKSLPGARAVHQPRATHRRRSAGSIIISIHPPTYWSVLCGRFERARATPPRRGRRIITAPSSLDVPTQLAGLMCQERPVTWTQWVNLLHSHVRGRERAIAPLCRRSGHALPTSPP